MHHPRRPRALTILTALAATAFAAALPMLPGCSTLGLLKKAPPPREYQLFSPYATVRTLAVAPTVNLSGTREFDPLVVSDHLFEELQQVQRLNVLPLNKTISAMQQLGVRSINTPELARRVADALGADALVIASVTAYDPYEPPTVGMQVQLYTNAALAGTPPVAGRQINGEPLAPDSPAADSSRPRQPAAQDAAVIDAHNQTVLAELKDFTRGRTDYQSALQDRRFLADSDAYMRFVCHAMVRRLVEVERARAADR